MDPTHYLNYYKNQAGSGMPGYAGGGIMNGAGLGGLFRGLFRMALPLLKRGFSIARPHLKNAAKNIVSDVVTNAMTHSFHNNNSQDGSGLMVMLRKRGSKPPGVRRGRSGQTVKKTKNTTKKPAVRQRKRKRSVKRGSSGSTKRSVKTIF